MLCVQFVGITAALQALEHRVRIWCLCSWFWAFPVVEMIWEV